MNAIPGSLWFGGAERARATPGAGALIDGDRLVSRPLPACSVSGSTCARCSMPAQACFRSPRPTPVPFFTPTAFDFSVWEILRPLMSGGRCVITSEADTLDLGAFARPLARNSVTVLTGRRRSSQLSERSP
jgi:hypothetical protein